MIIQLVGVMLYGYCLGAVAAILTNVAIPRYTLWAVCVAYTNTDDVCLCI